MATLISHSPDETDALGEAWGRAAESGLVIGLCGDLGAGKTQLAKGLARGLGITARVHSPTFALINVYAGGRLPLFHLDLYRLETRAQIIAAGLEDYFHPAGVSVVEWAERWFAEPRAAAPQGLAPAAPETRFPRPPTPPGARLRWVTLETLSAAERRITYEDLGA